MIHFKKSFYQSKDTRLSGRLPSPNPETVRQFIGIQNVIRIFPTFVCAVRTGFE